MPEEEPGDYSAARFYRRLTETAGLTQRELISFARYVTGPSARRRTRSAPHSRFALPCRRQDGLAVVEDARTTALEIGVFPNFSGTASCSDCDASMKEA